MLEQDRDFLNSLMSSISAHATMVKDAKFVDVSRRDFKRIRKITGMEVPAFKNDHDIDVEVIQDRSLADGVISLRETKDAGKESS